MVFSFYLTALIPVVVSLPLSLIAKNQEMVKRGTTLFVLLHIICLALWLGPLAVTALLACLLVIGILELAQYYPTHKSISLITGLLWSSLIFYNSYLLFISLFLFLIISVIAFIGSEDWIRSPLFLISFALFFLAPCAVCLILLTHLHLRYLIILLLLLQLNDIFALLFGRLLGQTRIVKRLSPNKTLEGYLMGAVGIAVGLALLHTYISAFQTFTFYKSVVVWGYFWVFGNLGDLLFSSLKRQLQIKDFSHLLPGHGGILDRFDNIFFIAPGLYILVQWTLVG